MVGHHGGEASLAVSRILVTDAQDRPALAAIRDLHESGYRVGATANTRVAPGLWSRDCEQRRIVPDPSADLDRFIAGLNKVIRDGRYDVLLPGTDETLYAVSLRRDQLDSRVAVGLPDHGAVERAMNKACLAEEAEKAGFEIPEARVCERLEDALQTARSFGFPVLVKGLSAVVEADGGLVRYPSRLVLDEPGLGDTQRRFGTCIVQRREEGNMMSFAGVVTERGMLGAVACRYRRTFPPSAGQASFLETIAPPGDLTERVGALVDAIGWRGLFQLQLIERRDGATMPIDFNPRLYGSISVARAAGAPLATLWCAWLLGDDPKPVFAAPGVGYRLEDADARHVLWQLRNQDLRGAARAALPRRGTTHAYFQARDPLPLLVRGVELVRQRWRRAWAERSAGAQTDQ